MVSVVCYVSRARKREKEETSTDPSSRFGLLSLIPLGRCDSVIVQRRPHVRMSMSTKETGGRDGEGTTQAHLRQGQEQPSMHHSREEFCGGFNARNDRVQCKAGVRRGETVHTHTQQM